MEDSCKVAQRVSIGLIQEDIQIPSLKPKSTKITPQYPKESCFLSGGNGSIDALPSAVRFAGYRINERNVQTIQIRNRSLHQQRVHVLLPNTIEFDIQTENKGWIAPGLSLTVRIIFRPTEWRHHHDEIIVRHSDGAFIVPLDAFPILADAVFPNRIDMGLCSVGLISQRNVTLRSTIPFQFEFTLTPVKTSTEFSVTPLAGIVPGNGQIDITIQYHPLHCHTSEFLFQVQISELFFEPFICYVSGSASFPSEGQKSIGEKPSPSRKLFVIAPKSIGPRTLKSAREERLLPETINGIIIPERILGRPSAVNFVLSQVRRDVQGQNQNSENRNRLGNQNAIVSEEDGNSDIVLDNIDFSGRTAAEKIAFFEFEYQKAVDFRKLIANKRSWKRIGQRLLSDDQKRVIAERSMLLKQEFERQQIRSTNVNDAVCVPTGFQVNVQPSWDLSKSQRSIHINRTVGQLLLALNKALIRHRVSERIEKMKVSLRELQGAESVLEDDHAQEDVHPIFLKDGIAADSITSSEASDVSVKADDNHRFSDLDEQPYFPTVDIGKLEKPLPDVPLFQISDVQECDLKGYRTFSMDPFPGNVSLSVPGFTSPRVGAQSEDPILETRPPSIISRVVNRPEDQRLEPDRPEYIVSRRFCAPLQLDTVTEADPTFNLNQPMVVALRAPKNCDGACKEQSSRHLTELGQESLEALSELPTFGKYWQTSRHCSDITIDLTFELSKPVNNADFQNSAAEKKPASVSVPSLDEAKSLFNIHLQVSPATGFETARSRSFSNMNDKRKQSLDAFHSRIQHRLDMPDLHINFCSRPFIE